MNESEKQALRLYLAQQFRTYFDVGIRLNPSQLEYIISLIKADIPQNPTDKGRKT